MTDSWFTMTAQEEMLTCMKNAITQYKQNNSNEYLFLFGVGVRGLLFAKLLEQAGIKEFSFIDNSEEKQGQILNGHFIYSLENALKNIKKNHIYITVECSDMMIQQLESRGLCNEKDFTVLQPQTEQGLVKVFYNKIRNEHLMFGETQLSEIVLTDACQASLKEMLLNIFGINNVKILANNGMGMAVFYWLLRLQLQNMTPPKWVWLFINFEILTAHHHLLPRAQNTKLLNELRNNCSDTFSLEFTEYCKTAKEREKDYKIENYYSPGRMHNISDEENKRAYLWKSILSPVSEDMEEMQYFKRILELDKQFDIHTKIVLLPVNYVLCDKLLPINFNNIFQKKVNWLKQWVIKNGADWLDLSHLLKENEFISIVTTADAIRYTGRKKIADSIWNKEKK